MSELKSGTLHEPVELNDSELEIVAGSQATSFVKHTTMGYTSSGNHDKVTVALDLVTAGVVHTPVTPSAEGPSLQPLQVEATAHV